VAEGRLQAAATSAPRAPSGERETCIRIAKAFSTDRIRVDSEVFIM